MRRWLHEIGLVGKCAKLMAKDDDPHGIERLARNRWVFDQLKVCEAMLFTDELDIHLLPKAGASNVHTAVPYAANSVRTYFCAQSAQHLLVPSLNLDGSDPITKEYWLR